MKFTGLPLHSTHMASLIEGIQLFDQVHLHRQIRGGSPTNLKCNVSLFLSAVTY